MDTTQTHGTFKDILDIASPALRPICAALRSLVASQHTDFVELVWPSQKIASFGVGPKKMSHHYAYIGVQKSHVNLGFYHGASLADPTGLLEGTGGQMRHIKIRDVADVNSAAVANLLRQAIAERKPYK